ncbi:transposase [Pseudomonas sp. TE21394]
MSRQRYAEEFKIEAVKHLTEKGKPIADVAQRQGMSVHSLYTATAKFTMTCVSWERNAVEIEFGA